MDPKRVSVLACVSLMAMLLIVGHQTSSALKLPNFLLVGWRPTAGPTSGHLKSPQASGPLPMGDPLLASASSFEPETGPSNKFSGLTRAHSHHHHLPMNLFRSFPKSLFARFLPASANPPAAASTSAPSLAPETHSMMAPMMIDWSAIERPAPFPFRGQPQAEAYSNVYHFKAGQPMQANQFSVEHGQPQKHALGYGDSGEEFATIMLAEPQPDGQQQQEGQPPPQEQEQEQPTQAPAQLQTNETAAGGLNKSAGQDLLQLADQSRAQTNANSSSSNSTASPLTDLIGDELSRLRQRPEELNSTLGSMGQPLLALLMDQPSGDNSSTSTAPPLAAALEQAQSDSELSAPESGRSESAARAVAVAAPVADEEAAGAESHNQALAVEVGVGEDDELANAIADTEQLESFILGPFKGLTSERTQLDQRQQQQHYESQRQQPSVGMSAMASNLVQQAKSLIQMPFTNSPVHTIANQRQLLSAGSNRQSAGVGSFRGQLLQQQQQPARDYFFSSQPQQQSTSPAPFFFAPPAMTNNNYQRRRPAAWQQQAQNFAAAGSMMTPNHANNNNQPQLQQQRRPKNPFAFNRYFLMPADSTRAASAGRGHLHQSHGRAQPQPQPQVASTNVPYFGAGAEHPAQATGSDRAAGSQVAIEHSGGQQPRDHSLELARRRFRSGLYQIEPPRLAGGSTQGSLPAPSQQQKVEEADLQLQLQQQQQRDEQQQQQEADSESSSADSDDDGADNDRDSDKGDNRANEQQAASSASAEQTTAAEFATKQVGASIGFSQPGNSSSSSSGFPETQTHRGKVFNEPISDLMAPNGKDKKTAGRDLSETRQLKHSEEVTLYEFESPADARQLANPQAASAPTTAQNQQQQQLLDTQVFTVPHTITMQPNGRPTANYQLGFGPAQPRGRPQAHMITTSSNNNNFVRHRESPLAHSFISSTWTQPLSSGGPYFALGQRASPSRLQLPQLQYLGPPAAAQQQQQQLFKTIFEEAQQMASSRQPEWAHMPMRPVPALAIMPQQQQQQQHYFHYQPLQAHSQQTFAQRPSQQQQVIFELANQGHRQQPAAQQQAQFAMAIDHNALGSALLTSSRQSLEADDKPNAPEQQVPVATTTTTTVQPPATTSSSTETSTSRATTAIEGAQQRAEQPEPSSSLPPAREDDDDDVGEKLAHLRRGQQQQQQPQSPSAFCAGRPAGLYADEAQKCKAYYQCAPTGHQMFRCNNQTQFNQKTQNCDWWYNVNCAGQSGHPETEQLPQSAPLQRQSTASRQSAGGDEGEAGAGQEAQSSSSASFAPLHSAAEESRARQQATQRATASEQLADSGSTEAPASDQTTGSPPTQQQQQPAPTSSTPIYHGAGQQSDQSSASPPQAEFSARSTTTQDPLLLMPATTTVTAPAQTTTTTTGADQPDPTAASQAEVKPRVGAELGDSESVSFSSSTSISSEVALTPPEDHQRSATPTSDERTDEATPAAPKLAVRSLSGRISAGSIELPPAGGQQEFGSKKDGSIYSTSANQGSVSHTPMDTHQLTARAFREPAARPSAEAGAEPSGKRTPIEKRFGARLQAPQPTTTMSTPTSHR